MTRSEPEKRPEARSERAVPRAARVDRTGLITVASIAADAGVEASDVRALLRKRGIVKPDAGWAYAENDPQLVAVRDIIDAVKRGEKR